MLNERDTPLVGLVRSRDLAFQHGDAKKVALAERPFPELVNLRGDPADEGWLRAVADIAGVAPPTQPNTVTEGPDCLALWLGPDEWLLRSREAVPEGGCLTHRLEEALAGRFFAVTDQSSAWSVMRLHGPRATEVLGKGCPLDLHPRVLRLGQCAQSHYFRAGVLLRPLDARSQDWEIIVRRSFADATARMLVDAMEEYL